MNCFLGPNMDMSHTAYARHCLLQNTKEGYIMCKALSEIRHKSPQDLLELSGQANKIPVNMEALLQKLNISCMPFDFSKYEGTKTLACKGSRPESILGALVTDGSSAVIFYSEDDKKDSHRYRFTVAHELAHCCLAHYEASKSFIHFRKSGDPTDENEKAANVFAGELLIPEKSLIDVIDRLVLPSVQTLAKIFDVSEAVMIARLKYLRFNRNIIVGYNY